MLVFNSAFNTLGL